MQTSWKTHGVWYIRHHMITGQTKSCKSLIPVLGGRRAAWIFKKNYSNKQTSGKWSSTCQPFSTRKKKHIKKLGHLGSIRCTEVFFFRPSLVSLSFQLPHPHPSLAWDHTAGRCCPLQNGPTSLATSPSIRGSALVSRFCRPKQSLASRFLTRRPSQPVTQCLVSSSYKPLYSKPM